MPLTVAVTTPSSLQGYRKTRAVITDCLMTDAKENKEGSDNLLQSAEFSADSRKGRDSDRKRE